MTFPHPCSPFVGLVLMLMLGGCPAADPDADLAHALLQNCLDTYPQDNKNAGLCIVGIGIVYEELMNPDALVVSGGIE